MKILIIEDELALMQAMEEFLVGERYVVEKATNFLTAMDKALMYDYDCILLDINLPGGSGFRVLEEMKKEGKSGNIIIISARNSLEDKILGLDSGADDYLTKPFHLSELHARIKAVWRRKQMDGKQNLQMGNVLVDFVERTVCVDGESLNLNRKEFDLFSFFATNINRLLSKEAVAEHVWGDHMDMADNFDFVYSQVKNLRKKLKDHHADTVVENVYGIGYKLTI
ncbi:MAG: response regulator transcription factor [Prevotellaceae bacterium]|jgi:DNA-binding response OmpR family regulator|nr:response regulator transcription factor [Prevotellaceae bacterium]